LGIKELRNSDHSFIFSFLHSFINIVIMLNIRKFVFNPIQVNAFVIWDETLECVLIDPACYYPEEEQELKQFIEDSGLKPVRLLNTHGHFDHVMGNRYVEKNWKLKCEIHEGDNYLVQHAGTLALGFGIEMGSPPPAGHFLHHEELITFGNSDFKVIHVPGHSPGGVAFYSKADKTLITGDILFYRSIGRTDLPLGNHELLVSGIKEKLFNLDEDVKVWCGHGPETTIGDEKRYNPYLR
jgi:hydroxyacylglutathione hydrolase